MIKIYCDICKTEIKGGNYLYTIQEAELAKYDIEHLCNDCKIEFKAMNINDLVRDYLTQRSPNIPKEDKQC